ncbi:insulinase family protein [Patescibacteria group bacterium]|nr:insulinase family protein [Patescibacteria group bacterium]
MYRKSTLTNGLRVITNKMSGTNAVTCMVLVKAGSRWETKNISGISHFLEHMFFKGAKKYENAKAVSEAIDSVGGDFNAFTGKEYAGYYVKVASAHTKLALDVLSDMMQHARFAEEEIEKERGVILEEFNMYQDTPMYQVAWNFERAMFGDQPLGWDEIGLKDVIRGLKREDFVKYKESLYTTENMVLVMAGDVNHDEAEKLADKYFHMEAVKTTREMKSFVSGLDSVERVSLQTKKTEQTHLVCGVPGLPEDHKDHYVLKVLASVLGGSMSSRMFLAVREAKGLAYYISTGTEDYLDTGALYTRAGVDVNRVDDAVKAIVEEYDKVRRLGVPATEVKKGREFLKGKLTLRLEDSENLAQMYARDELLHDGVRTYAEIAKEIDEVTAEDVHRVAKDLLQDDALYLAVIGPYEDEERFLKGLKF